MTSLLLITNEDAGTSDERTLDRALAVLRAGATVEVAATSDADDLDAVLAGAGDRTVVVAGGDGSLHAVVRALHRGGDLAGRTLALLPLGTGNDFARGAEIPLDVEEAARLVLDGEARPVDLLVDDRGEVVVNNVHVGAGAAASRVGARWKERLGTIGLGRLGYPVGALVTAIDPPSVRVRVTVDAAVVQDVDRRTLMVALGNGSSVGGGAPLNPDADPEDGSIDVVLTRPLGPLARLGYAVRLGRGTHPEHERALHLRGRAVTIEGEAFWCSADGELDGPVTGRTWRIEPAAYAMVLPHSHR